MPIVHLLIQAVTGDMDLGSIDHDHEVAGVDARRHRGFTFS